MIRPPSGWAAFFFMYGFICGEFRVEQIGGNFQA
jgi:hypothetical protein